MTVFQIAALIYLLYYSGILLGFRGYLLYTRTGVNPIQSRKKTGVEGFIENVFKVCLVLMVATVLNYVFIEGNYKYLIPIKYLESNLIAYLGIFLGMFGLSFGFIAQLQMGDSWRLSLNENEKTDLVHQGLFAYSRNPIYLGYLISIIGFFMMMPNAISLCILSLSYVAIQVKIRLEEKYLIRINGIEYENYLARVRRWI